MPQQQVDRVELHPLRCRDDSVDGLGEVAGVIYGQQPVPVVEIDQFGVGDVEPDAADTGIESVDRRAPVLKVQDGVTGPVRAADGSRTPAAGNVNSVFWWRALDGESRQRLRRLQVMALFRAAKDRKSSSC